MITSRNAVTLLFSSPFFRSLRQNVLSSSSNLRARVFSSLPSSSSPLLPSLFISSSSSSSSSSLFLRQHKRALVEQLQRSARNSQIVGKAKELWFKSTHPATILLLGINCAVFLLWRISRPSEFDWRTLQMRSSGVISTQFMFRNFTLSTKHLREGRLHTLVTSSFSHKDFGHLAFNLFSGYFMASSLEALIGSRKLFITYLISGALSSLCQALLAPKRRYSASGAAFDSSPPPTTLGASGAIYGVAAIVAMRTPWSTVLLYGILPMPMASFVGLMLLNDVFNLSRQDGIGRMAHISGMAVGALLHLLRFV